MMFTDSQKRVIDALAKKSYMKSKRRRKYKRYESVDIRTKEKYRKRAYASMMTSAYVLSVGSAFLQSYIWKLHIL